MVTEGHPLVIAFIFTSLTLLAILLVLMAMNGGDKK